MNPKPGDQGGICPVCENDTTKCVGYGKSVFGVYCEYCMITTVLPGTKVHGGKRVDESGAVISDRGNG